MMCSIRRLCLGNEDVIRCIAVRDSILFQHAHYVLEQRGLQFDDLHAFHAPQPSAIVNKDAHDAPLQRQITRADRQHKSAIPGDTSEGELVVRGFNAVMHGEDDSMGENIVAEEYQKGYMYRESVVRYSMVKVCN